MNQNEPPPEPEKFEPFPQLIMMLATSAMQHLGVVATADGQRPPIDLVGAQFSIDILEMLVNKTQGNLDDKETALLNDTLSPLQMMFVQVSQQAKAGPQPEGPSAPPPEPSVTPADEAPTEPEPPPATDEDDEDKQPRFKKTYD